MIKGTVRRKWKLWLAGNGIKGVRTVSWPDFTNRLQDRLLEDPVQRIRSLAREINRWSGCNEARIRRKTPLFLVQEAQWTAFTLMSWEERLAAAKNF